MLLKTILIFKEQQQKSQIKMTANRKSYFTQVTG